MKEAASISITPQPDTTVRILMLFGAVDTTGSWTSWAGQKRNVRDALEEKNWAEITGIQPISLKDSADFRAIEWSVMQVAPRHLPD